MRIPVVDMRHDIEGEEWEVEGKEAEVVGDDGEREDL